LVNPVNQADRSFLQGSHFQGSRIPTLPRAIRAELKTGSGKPSKSIDVFETLQSSPFFLPFQAGLLFTRVTPSS